MTASLRRELSRLLAPDDAARSDLIAFTQRMFRGYQAAPHHRAIAAKLQAVAAGDPLRLIVTMPPRHGKSTLAAEHFPAWFLGNHPDKRVIGCSHTQYLADRFSRLARNKLQDPRWPFEVIRLAGDLRNVRAWDLAGHRGGYVAAGVGGPITGHGADLLLVDDPVKSAEEADSQAYRDRAWEWWTGTAATRLEPGGAAVVIGTRWHEDDLIGRLLQSGRWDVLHLPALSADGDPLWPERYDAAALAAIKQEVGSRTWEAQYQGRPSPAEGGAFKRSWWRYYREAPADLAEQAQSWDMTFRETKAGSYVVGQVWGRRAADCYLLDQVRFRGDFPATVQAFRALSAKWPRAVRKLVENKANGPAVVAALRHEVAGIVEVEPAGGKLARASAVAPAVESGNVWLPDPSVAPWVGDFVEEAAAFPFGANDDQVDGMSQALLPWLVRQPVRRVGRAVEDALGEYFG